jgi:hypothetical protein
MTGTTTAVTPAGQITRARATLCTVNDLTWPADRDSRRPLTRAFIALGDAIDTYDCLAGGLIHWENCYPELRDVTGEPEQAALDLAAEDAASAADSLTEIAGKCCTEAAAL